MGDQSALRGVVPSHRGDLATEAVTQIISVFFVAEALFTRNNDPLPTAFKLNVDKYLLRRPWHGVRIVFPSAFFRDNAHAEFVWPMPEVLKCC